MREKLTSMGKSKFKLCNRKALLSIAITTLMTVGLLGVNASASYAAPTATISIAPSFPTGNPGSTKTGTQVIYTVSVGCSNIVVGEGGCNNSIVEIPFNTAGKYDVTPAISGAPYTWNPTTHILTANLGNLAAGTSKDIDVTYTIANHVTPDGFSEIIKPTFKADGGINKLSSTSVTTNFTAKGKIILTKDIAAPKRTVAGQNFDYTISACYVDDGSGAVIPTDWAIEDVLPTPLTWKDSNATGWNPGNRTLTITNADVTLQKCSVSNPSPDVRRFRVGIPANTPLDTMISNTATMDGHFVGNVVFHEESKKDLTVATESIPGGAIEMSWYGAVSLGSTWAGDWIANRPTYTTPTIAYSPAIYNAGLESTVSAEYQVPEALSFANTGGSFDIPCMTNKSGQVYYPQTGSLCKNPAYNPITLAIGGNISTYPSNLILTRTDGTQFTLSSDSPAKWRIPDDELGKIIRVQIGYTGNDITQADGSLFTRGFFFATGGSLNKDMAAGESARIAFNASRVVPGEGSSVSTNTAIIKVAKASLGITKTLNVTDPQNKLWVVDGYISSPGVVDGDTFITDLLPADSHTTFTSGMKPVTVTYPDNTSEVINFYTEVIPQWKNTGRTLVRMTIPKETVNSARPAAEDKGAKYRLNIPIVLDTPIGTFVNTAVISTTSSFSPSCNVETPYFEHTNPGWDETPSITWTCSASRTLNALPTPGSAELNLAKKAKGDKDDAFIDQPGIASASSTNGSVEYELNAKNFGSAPLKNIVVYDIFPHVGDTGTVASTVNQPRGSTFRPTLTAVGTLPAGVVIAYSTSDNPCRPEVLPNASNPGCDATWTTVQPALNTVKAIKLTSASTYLTGEGFSTNITFSLPTITDTDFAWNTIGGIATNGNTNKPLAQAVEPPPMGVTMYEPQGLTIKKTSNFDPVTSLTWGTMVNWSYEITNLGSRPAQGISVVDDKGVVITCPSTTLVGHGTMTCTGSGRVK